MKKIELEGMSSNELKELIAEAVTKGLKKHAVTNQNENDEYISRQDVAKIFKVSLATVDSWRRKGILKPYKMGNLVFFKKSELHRAPKSIDY